MAFPTLAPYLMWLGDRFRRLGSQEESPVTLRMLSLVLLFP